MNNALKDYENRMIEKEAKRRLRNYPFPEKYRLALWIMKQQVKEEFLENQAKGFLE